MKPYYLYKQTKQMKTLFESILEARELIGTLPFTRQQFKDFIAAVDDCDDDSEAWQAVERAVKDSYGQKTWNGFKGWCEGTQYGSDPDEMYDILCKMPKNRLDKILGAGSYGAAIELADGRVCKLFHKNTPMEKADRKFYEYCMKHDTSVFPKIYKLGGSFVIMEKLKMNTPKCKLWDKYLGFNAKPIPGTKYTLDEIAKQSIKGNTEPAAAVRELGEDVLEILGWAVDALTHLKEAVGWDSFSDMKLANIGERADGSIIWFDI